MFKRGWWWWWEETSLRCTKKVIVRVLIWSRGSREGSCWGDAMVTSWAWCLAWFPGDAWKNICHRSPLSSRLHSSRLNSSLKWKEVRDSLQMLPQTSGTFKPGLMPQTRLKKQWHPLITTSPGLCLIFFVCLISRMSKWRQAFYSSFFPPFCVSPWNFGLQGVWA